MNKKELRQAMRIAIQGANERDAKSLRKRDSSDDSAKYYRLSGCLALFAGAVRGDCPDVAAEIMTFLHHVISDTNPLLDAAGSSKEPK